MACKMGTRINIQPGLVVCGYVESCSNLSLADRRAKSILDGTIDTTRRRGEAWSDADRGIGERAVGNAVLRTFASASKTESSIEHRRRCKLSGISWFVPVTSSIFKLGLIAKRKQEQTRRRISKNVRKSPFVAALDQQGLVDVQKVSVEWQKYSCAVDLKSHNLMQ